MNAGRFFEPLDDFHDEFYLFSQGLFLLFIHFLLKHHIDQKDLPVVHCLPNFLFCLRFVLFDCV